jgi:large subunit ribosomal protein L15
MDIGEAKERRHPRSRKKRVGRGVGSGHGKTSGRGHKGAKSRSGWSSRGMTGGDVPFWRRLPQRGFSNAPFRRDYQVVNVAQLNRFEDGTVVTPALLRDEGVVKQQTGAGVKILGDGELVRKLTVHADAFSRSAVAKIQEAGGTVEVIPGPKPPVRNKAQTVQPELEQ